MELFEAKSNRGLEKRVDESDLRNLYRAGYLHLDSPVRRVGSPNWFRVEEMFPQFDKVGTGKKYSANFKVKNKGAGLRTVTLIIVTVLVVTFLLIRLTQKIATQSTSPQISTQQN